MVTVIHNIMSAWFLFRGQNLLSVFDCFGLLVMRINSVGIINHIAVLCYYYNDNNNMFYNGLYISI